MVTVALSIAGSDPSGGAGIQADLKTFHQHGVYGCAVVSVLTVQNTTRVAQAAFVDPELIADQIDRVIEDMPVAAAKTGALGTARAVVEVAARFASQRIPLVVDPVRLATHGATLIEDEAREALLRKLMPCAVLITPNAQEASWLTGLPVRTLEEAAVAGKTLLAMGANAVLLKGGHLQERDAVDLFFEANAVVELRATRVLSGGAAGSGLHGLGCTLSAAITARIARGLSPLEACLGAKEWLSRALESAPRLGHGRGPVNHFAPANDLEIHDPTRAK